MVHHHPPFHYHPPFPIHSYLSKAHIFFKVLIVYRQTLKIW